MTHRFVLELPDQSVVERLLQQYAPVALTVDTSQLQEGDRRALRHLIDAAGWIGRIYWKQRSEFGWTLKQRLSAADPPAPKALQRLVDLGFGPWDVLDGDRPFWGDITRPPGGAYYPADLTREEIHDYIERHEDQREALLSPTTFVRREGDRLIAEPYVDVFREQLGQVGEALMQASRGTTHAGFARFLRSRAADLQSGSLTDSEAQWIGVGDSAIDIAIGPYEVYDDRLLGLKTSYEATVLVRHPMSARLSDFETLGADLAGRLPGAVAAPRDRQRVVIGVYDVVFAAGSTNIGAKAIAAMLPNDERVRREHGSRLLLFRNVISAKFQPILHPIATRVLRADQAAFVREDIFVLHTLFHEMAHALVASHERDSGSGSVNQRLRERYSTIEECRADVVALVLIDHLAQRGVLPERAPAEAIVTFVAGCLRVLRFGSESDYAKAATIALSHLFQADAIGEDLDGRLVVKIPEALAAMTKLAERVQQIVNDGEYDEAGVLIEGHRALPASIATTLGRLGPLPVDLEFTFDPSLVRVPLAAGA